MQILDDNVKDSQELNEIIKRLNKGESLKKIAADYFISKSALNKRLNNAGFKWDKINDIWYLDSENNMAALDFMNSIEIEGKIDEIAGKRYYSSFKGEFEDGEEMKSNWDNMYKEYVELAKKYNCDFDIEYMLMVLLDHLDKIDKKDLTEEFSIKFIKESEDSTKEEIDFLLSKIDEGYPASDLIIYQLDWECNEDGWNAFLKEKEESKEFTKKYAKKNKR